MQKHRFGPWLVLYMDFIWYNTTGKLLVSHFYYYKILHYNNNTYINKYLTSYGIINGSHTS